MNTIPEKSDYGIVFYGTPDFAVESLDKIVAAGYQIKAVVTVADKPAGRGRKIKESPVKKYAADKGYTILQPENLKNEIFLNQLAEIKPDLQIVVAFRMLPNAVITAAKDGTINLHASLLPQYRGAAPINHAIMQGEKETGVTTFFIDSKIDTGNIIDQAKVSILQDDTAGKLHDRLKTKGAELLVETTDKIRQKQFKTINQTQLAENQTLKKAPKIFKENCYINFAQETEKVYNFIRGLSPYPAARIKIKNKNNDKILIAFLEEVNIEQNTEKTTPAQIITDNKKYLKISTIDGLINISQIKLQNKKSMSIKNFLNGFDVTDYELI